MNIAILGTRGIPNNYGGFEQFAENLSVRLAKRGHRVTVYNPHFHYYQENLFNGVEIIRIHSPEKWIGAAANYYYDCLCLKNALKKNYDIILECGAASPAFSFLVCKIKGKKVFTNPDGFEWKRKKWGYLTKKIIKFSQNITLRKSPYIISDHPSISRYIKETYSKKPIYIPYGANIPKSFDKSALSRFHVLPNQYSLMISRLIPENNIKTIIEGYLSAAIEEPLLIVGWTKTKYANYLKKKFSRKKNIRFIDSIYDQDQLDNLRHYSKIYFHGHSVGGTNPSLLEAMACSCYIVAHENEFNKYIIDGGGRYFKSSIDVSNAIKIYNDSEKQEFVAKNLNTVQKCYNWDLITDKYEEAFGLA